MASKPPDKTKVLRSDSLATEESSTKEFGVKPLQNFDSTQFWNRKFSVEFAIFFWITIFWNSLSYENKWNGSNWLCAWDGNAVVCAIKSPSITYIALQWNANGSLKRLFSQSALWYGSNMKNTAWSAFFCHLILKIETLDEMACMKIKTVLYSDVF